MVKLDDALRTSPEQLALFFTMHPKMLQRLLRELQSRRSWAMYELREAGLC